MAYSIQISLMVKIFLAMLSLSLLLTFCYLCKIGTQFESKVADTCGHFMQSSLSNSNRYSLFIYISYANSLSIEPCMKIDPHYTLIIYHNYK